jgi:hypothetical protein
MSDEKIDPPGAGVPELSAAQAAEVGAAPRVHVGVGMVVEKKDGGRRGTMIVPNLAASRRCMATIPENLNDIWWRDAKMDKPVDGVGIMFFAVTKSGDDPVQMHYCTGSRALTGGVFQWWDGHIMYSDEQVTHWVPLLSVPK